MFLMPIAMQITPILTPIMPVLVQVSVVLLQIVIIPRQIPTFFPGVCFVAAVHVLSEFAVILITIAHVTIDITAILANVASILADIPSVPLGVPIRRMDQWHGGQHQDGTYGGKFEFQHDAFLRLMNEVGRCNVIAHSWFKV